MVKKYNLDEIAEKAMVEKDLVPEFEEPVVQELREIRQAAPFASKKETRDLRELLFFSIDNVDSLDLDQLTYAEKNKIYVAVADVDALVKKESPIDLHAQANTTSVYTPSKVFPMLPQKLSNDLTSLNEGEDRLAIIMELEVKEDGSIGASSVYKACVQNKAKLNYDQVAGWIEDPLKYHLKIKDLLSQIMLQDELAQRMQNYRHQLGALSLDPLEVQPIVMKDEVLGLKELKPNRATAIIENFMIAANGASTRYLNNCNFPTFRRVVRVPKNWDRIVSLAKSVDYDLPVIPEALELEKFLRAQRKKNPDTFPDISLAVIKLLGRGEYVVNFPGEKPLGHFGLAVTDYSHSTAPNRRYPDLITQRLIKAALKKEKPPYSKEELLTLAIHCTAKEDDAQKVERKVKKAAAAIYLSTRIGHSYNGIVTGAGAKGTWVRIFHPPVEGKILKGFEGLAVGDRVKVKLIAVDVPNGYIDFVKT